MLLGVPALFHTGQNGIGAGLPGGRGIKLRYSNPILLDDVAADFPGLPVILAHPSVPWQAEAISMATHQSNVYIDLAGWRPKYFTSELGRAAGGLLRRKVLFGSDDPLITPERRLADFAELGIDEAHHEAGSDIYRVPTQGADSRHVGNPSLTYLPARSGGLHSFGIAAAPHRCSPAEFSIPRFARGTS